MTFGFHREVVTHIKKGSGMFMPKKNPASAKPGFLRKRNYNLFFYPCQGHFIGGGASAAAVTHTATFKVKF